MVDSGKRIGTPLTLMLLLPSAHPTCSGLDSDLREGTALSMEATADDATQKLRDTPTGSDGPGWLFFDRPFEEGARRCTVGRVSRR